MKMASNRVRAFALIAMAISGGCSSENAPANGASASQRSEPPPIHSVAANAPEYKPAFPGQTRAPERRTAGSFTVTEIANGIDGGWAFEFLPDGRMLLSEKPGNLRIVGRDGKLSPPVAGLPKVASSGRPWLKASSDL